GPLGEGVGCGGGGGSWWGGGAWVRRREREKARRPGRGGQPPGPGGGAERLAVAARSLRSGCCRLWNVHLHLGSRPPRVMGPQRESERHEPLRPLESLSRPFEGRADRLHSGGG